MPTITEKPSAEGTSWKLADGSYINVPIDPSSEDVRKSEETFWASYRHGFHEKIGNTSAPPKSHHGSHSAHKK